MADSPKQTSGSTTRSRGTSEQQDLRDRLGVGRSAGGERGAKPTWRSHAIDALKTLLWVVPLTVLIWVYAEREQRVPLRDLPVRVEVKSNQPDRIVTLLQPEDGRVYIDLRGPQGKLEDVRTLLADPRTKPVEIVVPEEIRPGFEGDFEIATRLKSDELFLRNLVDVENVRPSVKIRVEEKVRRQVPVQPQPALPGDVAIEPENVTLEGSPGAFQNIPEELMIAVADLSKFTHQGVGTYTETVPVRFPAGTDSIKIVPSKVTAKVEIRQAEAYELPQPVPIVVELPAGILDGSGQVPSFTDRYNLSFSKVTQPKVMVTGSGAGIEQLKQGKFKPTAVIKLTPEDLEIPGEKIKHIRPEDYRLPKDVIVTSPADVDVKINITPQ